MDEEYYTQYLEFEKNNPWYVARRELILQLISKQDRDKTIVDVGAGSGFNISFLKKKGFKHVFGIEHSKEFIKYAKPCILNSSISRIPLKENSVDIVLCLDILEHIEHEEKAIKEMARILKKDGISIITVPAINSLWSVHDEINKHFRRYNIKRLNDLLKGRFLIIKQTYWNSFLFLPIYMMKLYKRYVSKGYNHDFKERGKFINIISLTIFRIENYIISLGMSLPIGVSLITLAKIKK